MDSPSSPPPGSYPASLPPGWAAQWNEQYKAWYFFNSHTNVSQWDHPGSAQQQASSEPKVASNEPVVASDSQMADDEALAARLQAEEDSRATPQLNMDTHPYRGNRAMEDSDAALAARLQAEEDALAAQQRSPQPQQHPYSPNHFQQNPAFSPQQQQQPYGGDYMAHQQQPYQQPYQQQPYPQQQQGFGPQGYPQYPGYPNQQQAAYPNQQYGQPQPQAQTTSGQSGGFLGKLTDKAKGRLSAAGVNLPASSGSGGGIVGLGNSALAGFKDKLKTKNKTSQPQHNNATSNTTGYPMYGAYPYDNGGGHHGGHHGGHQGGHNGGGHHGGDGGGGHGGDGGGGGVGGG
ncbi:unnamed protein product [Clonostachys byssicola]|uniref:WW domain-containing protein n=1 Tax=Clonostachys byssicola TaxID=160290 RepID=A0A9N9Y619_9HYPO|nr:unnamed protein product [Clonostachys byssicola]